SGWFWLIFAFASILVMSSSRPTIARNWPSMKAGGASSTDQEAYKITSNSWEGTGDGHALAYQAGAELMDMEFIQFHPTGMIWPPSVQGILVTEGVRGEGGVLLNSEGRRFMFDSIPDNYRSQTADNEDEGWRYTQGDKNARRPPELLTRDHVARCIMREVKAGRGSPRGGVFLDISWIKKRLPDAEAHIRRKLPSMYHQFKELADIDITKEPMEIGPTTHYIMGGVRVDGDTQMSTVFGKRAGEYAAQFAQKNGRVAIDQAEVTRAADAAVKPFERQSAQENPYAVQSALQETMQSLVGIVRTESEMQQALEALRTLTSRAAQASVTGHREYNPGWHTAIDLQNLLTVSEAITRSAIERKESRGGHFREDFPDKLPEFATFNIVTARSADGNMAVRRVPIPPIPPELKQIIEDQQK
ncbi:MAG: FAD-binding protein, partial [Acidobacteria bacterium]|nr:FAD-binding protein [Acidobacteriota bacterium]